ncbi:MAG: rRNA maturation RNase YbeY [Lachnospiraceae bacterium]|nr:rRNA maturation RNase YbeY [Lachnospiraceae bacterium]
MTFLLESEVDLSFDFDAKALFEQAASAVLAFLKCPYEASVSLLVTDDPGIREINREMRKIDAATDVLSFPMSEYEKPGDFSHLEEDPVAFDPDSGELLLGDIVLSADHVRSNAVDFNHSLRREFAFLIVHSMLHLTGFDHMEESDRTRMETAQKEVMQILDIPR